MIKKITIPCMNYTLEADWHEGNGSYGVLLAFVGFGSSKKNNSEFTAHLVAKTGLNALVVDLSGHGESPFDINITTPAQHIQEAVAAYDWIANNHQGMQICIIGTSYGGYIAAYLSKFRPVEKLILRTPAIYEPSSLFTQHQFIDKLQVREYRKNASAIKSHSLFLQNGIVESDTLLVVHGKDASVPPETTDVYKEHFNANVYLAEGFVHAFRDPANPQDDIELYYTSIVSWLLQK